MRIKNKIAIFLLLLCAFADNIIYAALISDNDSAPFVTKAEFSALKENVRKEISDYEKKVDEKIDGMIDNYLQNMALHNTIYLGSMLDGEGKYGSKILRWSSDETGRRDSASQKYLMLDLVHWDAVWYPLATNFTFLHQIQTAVVYEPIGTTKATEPAKYNTWRYEYDLSHNKVYVPGILTPKVKIWISWFEQNNISVLNTWKSDSRNFVTGKVKRNETNVLNEDNIWGMESPTGSYNIISDISVWDTSDANVDTYTVYPKSTSKEYCFTDDSAYVATEKIKYADSATVSVKDKGTYNCTPYRVVTDDTKSVDFLIGTNYYNPSFSLVGDKSNELTIKNWVDISSKNKQVKNGVYVTTIVEDGIGLRINAKSETEGKLYVYIGDNIIDMLDNLDSCDVFESETYYQAFPINRKIKRNQSIWIMFLPNDPADESYCAIDYIMEIMKND